LKTDIEENYYLGFLEPIAVRDAEGLLKAHKSYHNSWKQRGGVGAFMMLARKWDRLEARCGERPENSDNFGERYDIFEHVRRDPRTEGILDDIRDLRRYLLLVEAELVARGDVELDGHRDNIESTEQTHTFDVCCTSPDGCSLCRRDK